MGLRLLALWLAAASLASCATTNDVAEPAGSPTPSENSPSETTTAAEVGQTGRTAYLPAISGYVAFEADVEKDRVVINYGRPGSTIASFTVSLLPTPDGDLCDSLALFADARLECTTDGDTMTSPFEEMAAVAVRRSETTIYARGFVHEEDDPSIAEILAVLQTAPIVDPGEITGLPPRTDS